MLFVVNFKSLSFYHGNHYLESKFGTTSVQIINSSCSPGEHNTYLKCALVKKRLESKRKKKLAQNSVKEEEYQEDNLCMFKYGF